MKSHRHQPHARNDVKSHAGNVAEPAMARLPARARLLLRRLRGNRGFALIVSVAVLAIAILIGLVVTLEAVSTSHATGRDVAGKRAIQAADAGIQLALQRMNAFHVAESDSSDSCVIKDESTGVLSTGPADGDWCDPLDGELGNGASYEYWVKQIAADSGTGSFSTTIVSSGTVRFAGRDVTRRVAIDASASAGTPLFQPGDAIESLTSITLSGGQVGLPDPANPDGSPLPNPDCAGVPSPPTIRANGEIYVDWGASVYGSAVAGPDGVVIPEWRSWSDAVSCSHQSSPAGTVAFPEVEVGAPNTNDDDEVVCMSDPDDCKLSHDMDGFTIGGATQARLTGNNYVFCSFTVTAGGPPWTLKVDPTNHQPVRIFTQEFSASGDGAFVVADGQPGVRVYVENLTDFGCPPTDDSEPHLTLTGSGRASSPARNMQFYVLDGSSVAIKGGSGGSNLTLFAPESTVTLSGSGRINGAIAANQVTMSGAPQVVYDRSAGQIKVSSANPVFARAHYTECTAATAAGAAPDDGC